MIHLQTSSAVMFGYNKVWFFWSNVVVDPCSAPSVPIADVTKPCHRWSTREPCKGRPSSGAKTSKTQCMDFFFFLIFNALIETISPCLQLLYTLGTRWGVGGMFRNSFFYAWENSIPFLNFRLLCHQISSMKIKMFFPTFLIQGSSSGKYLQAMRWVPEEAQPAGLHRCWGLLLEVSWIHSDSLCRGSSQPTCHQQEQTKHIKCSSPVTSFLW